MKIVDMEVSAFWKGEQKIKGIVEDEGVKYRAEVYLRDGKAYEHRCSCPRGSRYGAMCHHANALYNHYMETASERMGTVVSTSQNVRTMIWEYTNREVVEIIRSDQTDSVRLVPQLSLSRRQLKLTFRLGRDRLYVLKNLTAFVKAMETGGLVEYGKSLAFYHCVDAFQEESRPLAEFLMEMVNGYEEACRLVQKSIYATPPVIRELELGKGARDRFFGLMMGKSLELTDYMGAGRKVEVVDAPPRFSVKVEPYRRDGIRVSVPTWLMCFSGESDLYVVERERLCRCGREHRDVLKVFLEQMIQSYGASYEVVAAPRDIPLFYERVLKKIEELGMLESDGVDLEDYRTEKLKARFEFDSPDKNQLTLRPVLSYGDCSFYPMDDEQVPKSICRDVPGEFRIGQLIIRYFHYRDEDGRTLVIRDDDDAMYRLMTEGMAEFMELGEVYLSEAFQRLRVLPPPAVSVGIRAIGNWLELTVDAGDMPGAELARVLAEYNPKKKYYRLKNGEFLRIEGQGIATVAGLAKQLSLSKGELQKKAVRLPAYRALYLDSVLKGEPGVSLYRDQLFKAVVRGMKSVEDSDYEVPAGLKQVLRAYQKTGFRWLKTLDSYRFGGILADDMGLGKTIQVIALLEDEQGEEGAGLSLIVCPASLVYNWENEIRTFAPGLRSRMITGTAAERRELVKQIEGVNVLITSYDLLKRDIELYQGISFRYQIIDEAQFIKNSATQSARAVKQVEARTRFALTGTPIENRLGELWSIFEFLMPGFLFSYQRFKKEYELPIVKNQDREALDRLRRMTGPFILRRLKKDVLRELPEKLETVVYSRCEGEQKTLYTANAIRLKEQLESQSGGEYQEGKLRILAELTRLRQICCDPRLCYEDYRGESAKLNTCVDLVKNGVEGGHKLLLFSQFTSMLELIGSRLDAEGVKWCRLVGATPKEERIRMVNEFQQNDVPVFLISLKAGGTGLNLTAADIVIHYDPWWNVAAQNQATDRTHRIGQERQVTVFKLIIKDTIEENILKLQEAKRELAEQIITGEGMSFADLSREDLMKML